MKLIKLIGIIVIVFVERLSALDSASIEDILTERQVAGVNRRIRVGVDRASGDRVIARCQIISMCVAQQRPWLARPEVVHPHVERIIVIVKMDCSCGRVN
jgi:hypothetical protein